MRVITISHTPIPAAQFEKAGCHLVGKATAGEMVFTVLTCDEEDHHLTPRQTEVLRLTAGGMTVAEVAHRLHLSRKTIERHLRHCRQRLSAASDVQLGVIAERLGL